MMNLIFKTILGLLDLENIPSFKNQGYYLILFIPKRCKTEIDGMCLPLSIERHDFAADRFPAPGSRHKTLQIRSVFPVRSFLM